MTKRDLVVASTRHHCACLLKYYQRPPCAPSFVKSRMLRPLQTYFLRFQQIFFILVCIHAENPRVPPRVLAWARSLRGKTKSQKYKNHHKLTPRASPKLSIKTLSCYWFFQNRNDYVMQLSFVHFPLPTLGGNKKCA